MLIKSVRSLKNKQILKIMVIDSIQVMQGCRWCSIVFPGSVAQVRESATALTRYAKQNNVAVFLVGHVTGRRYLSFGPKVFEHIIDCSVPLDGGTDSRFRTLRAVT